MCVHAIAIACTWIHVVPVDEPGTTLYICTNNIMHAHTHCLPIREIKLNSCTRQLAKSGNQQAPAEAQ